MHQDLLIQGEHISFAVSLTKWVLFFLGLGSFGAAAVISFRAARDHVVASRHKSELI